MSKNLSLVSIIVGLAALTLFSNACSVSREDPLSSNSTRQSLALKGSNHLAGQRGPAEDDAGTGPCGKVTSVGCCSGDRVYWCEQNQLRSLLCERGSPCGWTSAGQYDCRTTGQEDPSGAQPIGCELPPRGDGGAPSAAEAGVDNCQGITREGCCQGEILAYCLDHQLKIIHCGLNLECGWLPGAQYYDCGTEGKVDTSETYSKSCPFVLTYDGGPVYVKDAGIDAGATADAAIVDGSSDGGCSTGGRCELLSFFSFGLMAFGLMALSLGGRKLRGLKN